MLSYEKVCVLLVLCQMQFKIQFINASLLVRYELRYEFSKDFKN